METSDERKKTLQIIVNSIVRRLNYPRIPTVKDFWQLTLKFRKKILLKLRRGRAGGRGGRGGQISIGKVVRILVDYLMTINAFTPF